MSFHLLLPGAGAHAAAAAVSSAGAAKLKDVVSFFFLKRGGAWEGSREEAEAAE